MSKIINVTERDQRRRAAHRERQIQKYMKLTGQSREAAAVVVSNCEIDKLLKQLSHLEKYL